MPRALAYHRPSTLDEAVSLLAVPGRVVLGGGTIVNTPSGDPCEVVDLQALGLDTVTVADSRVRVGSMVTLQSLVEDERIPRLVRDAARREVSSVLRNQATLGGVVGSSGPDSLLLGALLVSDATVELSGPDGTDVVGLAEVTTDGPRGRVITVVEFALSGTGAIAATGRTPGDVPIVAAVARNGSGGLRLALTGVAPTVVLVDPADLDGLSPQGDFRGTPDYRRHLAGILARRVTAAVME